MQFCLKQIVDLPECNSIAAGTACSDDIPNELKPVAVKSCLT